MSATHREMLEARIAELKSRIGEGGLREAAIRGLLYVGSARGMVDERSLEALRNVRRNDTGARLTLTEFKMLVREQFFMLLLDQEAALAAIPKLLPDNAGRTPRRPSRRSAKCCPRAPQYRVRPRSVCSVLRNFSA